MTNIKFWANLNTTKESEKTIFVGKLSSFVAVARSHVGSLVNKERLKSYSFFDPRNIDENNCRYKKKFHETKRNGE